MKQYVQLAFDRWNADEDLRVAIPIAMVEASDGRGLLEACRHVAVDPALVNELEALVLDKEAADDAIYDALERADERGAYVTEQVVKAISPRSTSLSVRKPSS